MIFRVEENRERLRLERLPRHAERRIVGGFRDGGVRAVPCVVGVQPMIPPGARA
jgi:hypothetical protein